MTDIYSMRVRYQNAAIITSHDVAGLVTSEWNCFTGRVVVQVTGPATDISVLIQRSSLDPQGALGANPAPADDPGVQITGNPSTGISPVVYQEPAVGWWRFMVTSITGEAHISISGFYGTSSPTLPGIPI